MKQRISREELYISIAELIAKRSTCGRLNVGCVITREGRIIASGYNGPTKNSEHCNDSICNTEDTCKRSIHAEANAIAHAARFGISLQGTVIYCTHLPCLKCSELIVQSGITEVIYLDDFRDLSGKDFLIKNKVYVERYTKG